MILVDTSVWVDHLREGDLLLSQLLERGEALAHPWIIGELALGRLRARSEILRLLQQLPQATIASADELLGLIERKAWFGSGIGYVDAQLLAATMLTDDSQLWTHDRRLRASAERVGVAYKPERS